MKSGRLTRVGVVFLFVAVAATLGLAAGQAYAAGAADDHTVLILGSSVTGGTSSEEATQATALGFTVEVASDAVWGAKSQADFATYRALILGDPTCVVGTTPITAAIANRTTWSPAINGNIIILGTDEVFHSGAQPGAVKLSDNAINFAANIAGKTGLMVSLSCYYTSTTPPVAVPVLDQFGSFMAGEAGGCFNDAHIVAVHPVLSGLTDADLSNWSCSVHEIFTAFPSAGFLPLAIARGITGTGSLTFADGSFGVPYILAKGSGLQPVGLNIHKTGPATASIGSDITYTITYGNTGASAATSVVITDPVPTGTTFVSATGGGTFAAGVVTWNIGTLAAGTSGLTVSYTVHIDSGATITNTAYQIAATGVTPVVGPDVITTTGGGPGPTPTPGPVAPIPTLSFPMLALLGVLLVTAALYVLMRR